jgi:hypothetical protein
MVFILIVVLMLQKVNAPDTYVLKKKTRFGHATIMVEHPPFSNGVPKWAEITLPHILLSKHL